MSFFETIGATGTGRARTWAFTVTGIIAGGVFAGVAAFGIAVQIVFDNFVLQVVALAIAWIVGAAVGGAIGLLLGNLAERLGSGGVNRKRILTR